MRKTKWKKILVYVMCSMLIVAVFCGGITVEAATVYVSDGIPHDEGYIFVGESHMHVAAFAMKEDEMGNIPEPDVNALSVEFLAVSLKEAFP